MKRIFDLSSSFSILVIVTPLLIVISFLIKISDRGPVLFKQTRVGRHQKSFNLLKFRSMPLSTPNVSSSELSNIRLNIFQKFIRRTNIDELPQLINILKGEMSLIGPRPCLESQKRLICLRNEKNIFSIKPGLTGFAQVNSFDDMSEIEKVNFDFIYLQKKSFIFDMKIILKTFIYLLKPPPKY